MTFVTIGGRSVNLDQVAVVKMTGAGDAAELLIEFSARWLKLSGAHAVSLHGKLREAMRPQTLTKNRGIEPRRTWECGARALDG